MSRLVNDLIRKGYLSTDSIIDAFSKVSRTEFISSDLRSQADANISLPIGHGQTIPEPLIAAFMLELLDPKSGQNILDIGSGSGWTTALLAYIVGTNGSVTALEIIPELCKFGEQNVNKFSFIKDRDVQFYCQSAKDGFEKNAPYDRILFSVAVNEIPIEIKRQLKIGGKLIAPIRNEIWFVEKIGTEELRIEKFSGFSFVPFIDRN